MTARRNGGRPQMQQTAFLRPTDRADPSAAPLREARRSDRAAAVARPCGRGCGVAPGPIALHGSPSSRWRADERRSCRAVLREDGRGCPRPVVQVPRAKPGRRRQSSSGSRGWGQRRRGHRDMPAGRPLPGGRFQLEASAGRVEDVAVERRSRSTEARRAEGREAWVSCVDSPAEAPFGVLAVTQPASGRRSTRLRSNPAAAQDRRHRRAGHRARALRSHRWASSKRARGACDV